MRRSLAPKLKRRRWTEQEEEIFFKKVLRHGPGYWSDIRASLGVRFGRTPLQLKDKWRNLVRQRDRFADLERMFGKAPRESDGTVQVSA